MLREFSQSLELALLAADAHESESIARDALRAGIPSGVVVDAVIRPAMGSIGERWEHGEITPGEEHLASELVLRLRVLLKEVNRVEERRLGTPVLLAAAQGEQHVIGLTMAADLLDDAGYRVLLAGPDVPIHGLKALLARHRPEIVAFTSTMRASRASLALEVEIAREAGTTGVLAGGMQAQQSLAPAPWLRTVDGVSEVVAAADGLLRSAASN
jgi:methanogenic corrinoid protein MtbC1